MSHARRGAVLRQVAIEIQRVVKDDASCRLADVDDYSGKALRAGVESEVERH